jgi:hypothetical protein
MGERRIGGNINTTKRTAEALVDASKEVGLKVNAEKTLCCCLVSECRAKS